MDPVTIAALLAGAGYLKGELIDKPQEKRDRKLQAEIARWAPWSSMKPDLSAIKKANPMGSALQGGVQGYQLGQSMKNSDAMNNYLDAQSAGQPVAVGTDYNKPTYWDTLAQRQQNSSMG